MTHTADLAGQTKDLDAFWLPLIVSEAQIGEIFAKTARAIRAVS